MHAIAWEDRKTAEEGSAVPFYCRTCFISAVIVGGGKSLGRRRRAARQDHRTKSGGGAALASAVIGLEVPYYATTHVLCGKHVRKMLCVRVVTHSYVFNYGFFTLAQP